MSERCSLVHWSCLLISVFSVYGEKNKINDNPSNHVQNKLYKTKIPSEAKHIRDRLDNDFDDNDEGNLYRYEETLPKGPYYRRDRFNEQNYDYEKTQQRYFRRKPIDYSNRHQAYRDYYYNDIRRPNRYRYRQPDYNDHRVPYRYGIRNQGYEYMNQRFESDLRRPYHRRNMNPSKHSQRIVEEKFNHFKKSQTQEESQLNKNQNKMSPNNIYEQTEFYESKRLQNRNQYGENEHSIQQVQYLRRKSSSMYNRGKQPLNTEDEIRTDVINTPELLRKQKYEQAKRIVEEYEETYGERKHKLDAQDETLTTRQMLKLEETDKETTFKHEQVVSESSAEKQTLGQMFDSLSEKTEAISKNNNYDSYDSYEEEKFKEMPPKPILDAHFMVPNEDDYSHTTNQHNNTLSVKTKRTPVILTRSTIITEKRTKSYYELNDSNRQTRNEDFLPKSIISDINKDLKADGNKQEVPNARNFFSSHPQDVGRSAQSEDFIFPEITRGSSFDSDSQIDKIMGSNEENSYSEFQNFGVCQNKGMQSIFGGNRERKRKTKKDDSELWITSQESTDHNRNKRDIRSSVHFNELKNNNLSKSKHSDETKTPSEETDDNKIANEEYLEPKLMNEKIANYGDYFNPKPAKNSGERKHREQFAQFIKKKVPKGFDPNKGVIHSLENSRRKKRYVHLFENLYTISRPTLKIQKSTQSVTQPTPTTINFFHMFKKAYTEICPTTGSTELDYVKSSEFQGNFPASNDSYINHSYYDLVKERVRDLKRGGDGEIKPDHTFPIRSTTPDSHPVPSAERHKYKDLLYPLAETDSNEKRKQERRKRKEKVMYANRKKILKSHEAHSKRAPIILKKSKIEEITEQTKLKFDQIENVNNIFEEQRSLTTIIKTSLTRTKFETDKNMYAIKEESNEIKNIIDSNNKEQHINKRKKRDFFNTIKIRTDHTTEPRRPLVHHKVIENKNLDFSSEAEQIDEGEVNESMIRQWEDLLEKFHVNRSDFPVRIFWNATTRDICDKHMVSYIVTYNNNKQNHTKTTVDPRFIEKLLNEYTPHMNINSTCKINCAYDEQYLDQINNEKKKKTKQDKIDKVKLKEKKKREKAKKDKIFIMLKTKRSTTRIEQTTLFNLNKMLLGEPEEEKTKRITLTFEKKAIIPQSEKQIFNSIENEPNNFDTNTQDYKDTHKAHDGQAEEKYKEVTYSNSSLMHSTRHENTITDVHKYESNIQDINQQMKKKVSNVNDDEKPVQHKTDTLVQHKTDIKTIRTTIDGSKILYSDSNEHVFSDEEFEHKFNIENKANLTKSIETILTTTETLLTIEQTTISNMESDLKQIFNRYMAEMKITTKKPEITLDPMLDYFGENDTRLENLNAIQHQYLNKLADKYLEEWEKLSTEHPILKSTSPYHGRHAHKHQKDINRSEYVRQKLLEMKYDGRIPSSTTLYEKLKADLEFQKMILRDVERDEKERPELFTEIPISDPYEKAGLGSFDQRFNKEINEYTIAGESNQE